MARGGGLPPQDEKRLMKNAKKASRAKTGRIMDE